MAEESTIIESTDAAVEPAPETRSPGQSAVVPVPGSLRHDGRKPSFWRRINLRSRVGLSSATGDDRMIARLDAIEARLESSEHELGERIAQLDERFTQVWEVEEQLSRMAELREMLSDMQERQGRIDGRLKGLERRLSFIAILAGTAAAAGIAAILIAFG